MPLSNWKCPAHGTVPLDHWGLSSGACSIYSARVIDSLLSHLQGDTTHVGTNLTPTTLLSCPRAILIERCLPYAASPEDFITPSVGSWAHDGLAFSLRVEAKYTHKVPVSGIVFGHPMVGEIDVLVANNGKLLLEDDKFTGAWGMMYRRDKGPSDDHTAQLSMYKLMRPDIDEMWVNYICAGSPWVRRGKEMVQAPRLLHLPVAAWDEERLLAHKPGGGGTSVQDHLHMLTSAWEQMPSANILSLVKSTPLCGQSMYRGDKCKKYCAVNEKCLADIEGRPGLLL